MYNYRCKLFLSSYVITPKKLANAVADETEKE